MSRSLVDERLECRSILDYVKTLSADVIERVYSHPACCLCVLRELDLLGQVFVMRLVFLEQPVPKAVVTSWVDADHVKQISTCASELCQLGLWSEIQLPGGLPGWALNATFRVNTRRSIVEGGVTRALTPCSSPDTHVRPVSALDAYCLERWQCVLHYMVGSSQQEGIAVDAVRILLHSGLMSAEDGDSQPVITRRGFQFLLSETGAQVWFFMRHYLDTCHTHGLDRVECLSLLLQLGFSRLGSDYSTAQMSDQQLVFLQHLREFGLVYQRKRSSGRFYPTRLAVGVGAGAVPHSLPSAGHMLVETNYRVYAYTCSDLQVALIGLFCEMVYRFPNLSVAILTRDSVRQALRSGITAEQILLFLRMHAHPETKRKRGGSPLPSTVVDQIKLWEIERNRFSFTSGVLYNQFVVQADFEMLRNFARDRGCLTWENADKRLMVVTREGHDEVKRFWKRYGRSGA